MDIRDSVLGEIAVRVGTDVSGIDRDRLVRQLLLFETVTIRSVRLREIPYLVRLFGAEGLVALIDSGVLKITAELSGIVGVSKKNDIPVLPPNYFSFGMYEIQNRETVLRNELIALQGVPGLGNAERMVVEQIVLAKLTRPPSDYNQRLLDQLESDLRTQTPVLSMATAALLKERYGENAPLFSLKVEEETSRTFHIVNDLSKSLGISEKDAHSLLDRAISTVGHINHRIGEMEAYSAITGFAESEAPLLFGKLAGIIKPLNPDIEEQKFTRIATIADFPELAPGKRVDVDRLLAARESAELREFRVWLKKLDGLTDDQIREMIGGVRNRLGSLVRGGLGKTLRLAATTVVGVINPMVGTAAGAFDTFLLEKVFPTSGVFAFLTKTYPSLFISP
jgi:hypothetical protein